jgi:hypothetical protein
MTKIEEIPGVVPQPRHISSKVNKVLYGLFVTTGIIFWIFSSDKISGTALFGLALIFDPFDQEITFSKRPFYQQAWLIVHVAIVLASFTIAFL